MLGTILFTRGWMCLHVLTLRSLWVCTGTDSGPVEFEVNSLGAGLAVGNHGISCGAGLCARIIPQVLDMILVCHRLIVVHPSRLPSGNHLWP